ncbi:hypothetical protein DYBT9623_03593 [Dyadobacter sp. CECT 9623]|uniref:Outer membrane protein beta-barrel domain-containing protein n=1 Tax=Dyadobacter linearis TaxID=2823330 RepID=A0ABN7RA22_9BACT|nr:hypothetical protein [Dyadobacter sp. CECT 9623]CAG5071597.1 hypothetical protein DYBT9623_03593 [Dyadobacter sp. CECT 9623]
MKSKILLSCTLLFTILISPALFAQNDEYYRPDSLRRETPGEPKEYTPKDTNRVAEKKPVVEFKQLPFIERLRAGGGFGLSLGTFTNINLSPMVGYELTEKLVGGVGITYMFFKQRYFDAYSYYGGKGFLMYNVIKPINLIAEVEPLNVVGNYQKRQWIVSPMLGAAYSVPTGGRIAKAVHFTLLYNFNYYNQVDNSAGPAAAITNLSPYGSPVVFRITLL